MLKIVEEFVVSLLGISDKSVPTRWHLQKEFFIFTKMNPKAQELFHFVKHYEGPYSQVLQDSVRDPMYYENAFEIKANGEIYLTEEGKQAFHAIKTKYSKDEKFQQFLQSLKLIRDIYEKLTKQELLFLMYITYPDFIEFSSAYDRLVKDNDKRKQLAGNLLKKGLITADRYQELIEFGTE
ncbi:MAG: hypothetical protein IAX21_05995 [Candidatus Bathyarchaeota archaeon]|nr:MAG: hypothetical protein NUK63_11445 [Candidatus Bathyarchaeum tardum]WNZ28233.1 MAG: hypothetical protein IAX21_05995 [Candidatus Bathyarchaeota archaeon]